MIQIYAKTNTDYQGNGDYTLFPSICECHAVLNGEWELELRMPLIIGWRAIEEDAVVSAPTFVGEKQLFRINKVEKTTSEIIAYAYPIFFDSGKDAFLMDVRPENKSGQQALDIMLNGTIYSGSSDITKHATAYFIRRNAMDALNGLDSPTFVQRWGGELIYDNYTVIANERAGGDYGVTIRYGKNISGMQYIVDMSDVITRIVPVAYNGRMLSMANKYVDSENLSRYANIRTKEIKFENVKLAADAESGLDDSDDIIICQTQQDLDTELIRQCNLQFDAGVDLPAVTIEVDMISLEDVEDYMDFAELERVGLGDTVHCYNTRLGITTDARAIEITWDCIRNKNVYVKLGAYTLNYFDKIASTVNAVTEIMGPNNTVMAERIRGVLDAMHTQLRYQKNAAQRADVRAILFEDTDPESPLYGALCVGSQGFQIADSRTQDGRDWDWTTAFTAKGGYADVMVLGTLSDKYGNNYWDLEEGIFRMGGNSAYVGDKQLVVYIQDEAGLVIEDYDEDLDSEAVFNKLTNNGEQQVIQMDEHGNLYINATYILAGKLSGEFIEGKKLRVTDTNNNTTLYIDDNGNVQLNVTQLKITGKNIEDTIKEIVKLGTNLLEDPIGLGSDYWEWSGTVVREQSDPDGGTNAVKITANGGDCFFSAKPSTNQPLKSAGQTYKFSVWLKAGSTINNFIISLNHQNGVQEEIQLTTSWKRYTIECKVDTITNLNHVTIGGWASFTSGTVFIYNPVVEYADPYMTQEIIFNRLTNNGAIQGIYMNNGNLYINASYIASGVLAGDLVDAKGIHVEDSDDNVTLDIDSDGNVTLRATSLSIGSKDIEEIIQDYSEDLDKVHGNLLEDPIGLSDDYWVYEGTLTRNQTDPNSGTNAVKLVANGSDCYFSTKASTNKPIKSKGQTYRFSVWLKAGSTINNFRLTFNHSDGAYEQVTVTTSWKRYTFECEVKNTITSLNHVVMGGFGTFTSGTVYIYNPVVEYTSPYIDQQVMMDRLTNGGANQGIYLQNGEVYINGAYIQSLLITASMIQSQDFYTVQATIGGFKIDSSSIYAEIQNGSTNLRTLELKNENQASPLVGSKGKITVRDSATLNTITLVDQRLYGNNTNRLYLRADADLSSDTIQQDYKNRLGKTSFMGDLTTTGDLRVSGTKSAVRKTDHYGRQAYYCYEMPAPMFGDIGDGVIDVDGTCYVELDDIFTESTSTGIQYQVFLQKCGPGDCWVEERNPEYFVVRGTPGLRFSWEVKGKQTGYEHLRFNDQHTEGRMTDFNIPDYEQESAELVNGMIQEEIMNYE